MKRNILSIVLTFTSIVMLATGQDGDRIYIDGTQWELLGNPIAADSVYFSLKAALPEGRSESTANWDGYTAFWSIAEDELCLDSICCEYYNEETKKFYKVSLPADTLRCIFQKFYDGKRIVATWLTKEIRVGKGHQIYYEHSGYVRNYEDEQLISIKQGKVTDVRTFQNYYVDGLSFDNFRPKFHIQNSEDLKKFFSIHTERYPELAGVKNIIFRIKEARIDDTGHLVECKIRATIRRDGQTEELPGVAVEMEEAMKAYHPWRVYFINGEYRPYGIKGYMFNYKLNDNDSFYN